MADKNIYFFGKGEADGNRKMKEILGGKGANLAEMSKLGIPVPPGFTLPATLCQTYLEEGKKLPDSLKEEILEAMKRLEEMTGKKFGDPKNPLLVSVRSGAAVSMPGMMDTILNLGLSREVVEGMAELTGSPRFAWDSCRRLVQMYGNVVKGIEGKKFENALEEVKEEQGVDLDVNLSVDSLVEVVDRYLDLYKDATGEEFPRDPEDQLLGAVEAVFASWNNERAIKYRQLNGITGLVGTAANVQTMVFGNLGENSATGVLFTRNPSTGENTLMGEILFNAQGEDVVAGVRTPESMEDFKERFPEVHNQLGEIKTRLENHYQDMQDLEFTVEDGTLYILQTRTGKRTGLAAVKMAVDMVDEGLIDQKKAILRIDPGSIDHLLHPDFDSDEKTRAVEEGRLLAKGLNAGPGAASGEICFDSETAEREGNKGRKIILVRSDTSPEDIGGMAASVGILTKTGGMTSHAALVARSQGKTCVVGCGEIQINMEKRIMKVGDREFQEFDKLSLDGTTGEVIAGELPTRDSEIIQVLDGNLDPGKSENYQLYSRFMSWSDQFRTLGVRTNADTPEDARRARAFGAEGIGLCRTEHMFFDKERIPLFRKMIMAKTREDREKALDELLPHQRDDFIGIFRAMDGLSVTIRFLDPPLHEFLPQDEDGQQEMAETLGISVEKVKEEVKSLHETNPMLGHRGCRLSITYPEIALMQTRAILEAAKKVREEGIAVLPEIMIPLVGTVKEYDILEAKVREVARDVIGDEAELPYLVGTMIEIPRACLVAGKIAEKAEFFSFGTNDLTQMTYGFSRDDLGTYLPEYLKQEVLDNDPFATVDVEGVGELMKMAVNRGRNQRKDLKVGICGEHGGDPRSVAFCHDIGLDYVSCSPPRVPVARLAAAKRALEEESGVADQD